MPLYAYKCSCGNEFELIVSKPDPDIPQPCPRCQELAPFFIPQGSRNGVKFLFDYLAPDS